jgi:hypothetical protein
VDRIIALAGRKMANKLWLNATDRLGAVTNSLKTARFTPTLPHVSGCLRIHSARLQLGIQELLKIITAQLLCHLRNSQSHLFSFLPFQFVYLPSPRCCCGASEELNRPVQLG